MGTLDNALASLDGDDEVSLNKLSVGNDGPAASFTDIGSQSPTTTERAVVAPSVNSAYDTVKGAINDGYSDIAIAEEITEANIVIPRSERRFRIEGVGEGMYQVINDPNTGDPIIAAEGGDSRDVNKYVHIKNIWFERTGTNCGIAIKGAKNIYDPSGPVNAAGSWTLENVRSTAGPIYMCGPRNVLINCEIANWSDNYFPIPFVDGSDGNPVYDKAAGYFRGTTFGQYGGTLSAKQEARTAAFYAVGGYSITGGVTFTNARTTMPESEKDAANVDNTLSSNVQFAGCSRGFVGGISSEGYNDYDVQFGIPENANDAGGGCEQTVFLQCSMFDSLNIEETSRDVTIYHYAPCTIRKKEYAAIQFIGSSSITFDDSSQFLPYEINHVNPHSQGGYVVGGYRDSPQTLLGLQVQESPPSNNSIREARFTLADGTNWDPVGNGNGALVTYDTDGSWKPIFEFSGAL